jgi:hypothetical protein
MITKTCRRKSAKTLQRWAPKNLIILIDENDEIFGPATLK